MEKYVDNKNEERRERKDKGKGGGEKRDEMSMRKAGEEMSERVQR